MNLYNSFIHLYNYVVIISSLVVCVYFIPPIAIKHFLEEHTKKEKERSYYPVSSSSSKMLSKYIEI